MATVQLMRLLSIASAVLVTTLLVGCHGPADPSATARSDIDRVLAGVADSLSRKEISPDVAGARQPAQTDLDEVMARTGWVAPTVSAGKATITSDHASAPLHISWPTGDHPYAYETRVDLAYVAGQWRWTWSPAVIHPRADGKFGLLIRRTLPDRGRILGADGQALVGPRPVVRVGLDKEDCSATQQADSASRIADQAGIDAAAFRKAVESAGPSAFVIAITYRDHAPFDVTTIPCGRAVTGTQILAPTKEFSAPLLGTVGEATKEMIDRSGGRIRAGDQVGIGGLQERYDSLLGGAPGWRVALADRATGQRGDDLFVTDPVPGKDLVTTLNIELQMKADDALKARGGVGAVIVLQPSTGKILALATSGSDQSLASAGRYPPGSTFKIVTALALLRNGRTPDSRYDCPASATVDGRTMHNYPTYPAAENGSIPLERAIAFSCNTAFINASQDYSDADLDQAARALGLESTADLGFPSFLGSVQPAPDKVAKAEQSFGQGTTLASPLATATVTASVAAGHTVSPYLLEDHRADTHPQRPLTGDETAALQRMMRLTVSQGSALTLSGVLDGAKTGTAEFDRDGQQLTHISMTGFTTHDLAIAAFGDVGNYGTDLAPVVRAVLG